MAPSREALLNTASKLIDSYNDWTIQSILSVRSPDCIQQILPKSLQRPALNNTDYAAYFEPIMSAFRNWKLIAPDEETFVDVEKRVVVMHAHSTADTDIGPYRNEYMLTLNMTDDEAPLVQRLEEFVDSGVSLDFMPRLRKHAVEAQGEKQMGQM